ncbi:hypothetical protein ElyMa_006212500, partial [Elysia marginata]
SVGLASGSSSQDCFINVSSCTNKNNSNNNNNNNNNNYNPRHDVVQDTNCPVERGPGVRILVPARLHQCLQHHQQ